MKLGTPVRFVVPDIEGVVVAAQWDTDEAKLKVLVRSGDGHERWFFADQLDQVGNIPTAGGAV